MPRGSAGNSRETYRRPIPRRRPRLIDVTEEAPYAVQLIGFDAVRPAPTSMQVLRAGDPMTGAPRICTSADGDLFRHVKRKRWVDHIFLLSGEWSESPFHQGNICLWIGHTTDRRWWALYASGFPRRIVAVAETLSAGAIEDIAAAMVNHLREVRDEHFALDMVDDYGDIDVDRFEELFFGRDDDGTP